MAWPSGIKALNAQDGAREVRRQQQLCIRAGRRPIILVAAPPTTALGTGWLTMQHHQWPMLPLTQVQDAHGQQLLLAFLGYPFCGHNVLRAIRNTEQRDTLVIMDTGHSDL
jgi:hypothetical protein